MAKKKSTSSKGTPGSKGTARRFGQSGKPRVPSKATAGDKPKRPRRTKSASDSDPNVQRLQRVMASAGVGSRRECEVIILEGRVEVDGQTVTELGTKVNVTNQSVYVDAVELRLQSLQYFMLNKPQGIVSTSNDPAGRMRVIDLINTRNRVYNVGRLDKSSEGLILVTNDGDLANRLTHPRYGVEKKYHVLVAGHPNHDSLQALTDGVYLAEGRAKATSAKFIKRSKDTSWIEVILQEGRNREIRRLLAKIGHKVLTLKRVAIGPLRLGELPSGAHRELTGGELRALRKASDAPKKRVAKSKSDGVRKKPRDLAEVKELAKKPVGNPKRTSTKTSTKKATSSSSRTISKPTRSSKSKPAKSSKPTRTGPGGRGRTQAAKKLKPGVRSKKRRK